MAQIDQTNRLVGIDEIAQQLGVKIKTVYGWVHMRQIPFVKVGRLVRFDLIDVNDWVKQRKVEVRNDSGYDTNR